MNTAPIPMKGEEQAKKKPPKFIEKVINKVEEVLTKPTAPESVSTGSVTPKANAEQPLKQIPQQPQRQPSSDAEQIHAQGSLGGSSEYVLPEGTTITLPDGNEFETHTKSKIRKVKGGEV